ncbi:MAG: hydroxymethylbilane synthase [Acidimicrobiia bacterium]
MGTDTVHLRLATRASKQARLQSEHIAQRLQMLGASVELVFIETIGDQVRDRPLWEIGGQGVFTKEVQNAVLDGRADVAVHSAKDLPSSWSAPGLTLACVPERADPRDALVGMSLDRLHHGATVATGSVRRKAQLANLRPDLHFIGLRGNIPTRIERARDSDVDAIVVAVTGATWVGMADRIDEVFEPEVMLPQIGQGALAIECRSDDDATREMLAALEHLDSRRAVDCERTYLSTLGGGCDLPVGGYALVDGHGQLQLTGLIAAPDGSEIHRDSIEGSDASIGAVLGARLLERAGHLLDR